MKGLSQKAGLSKPYTNHCVRASTVTILYQAGIDTQQICSITKHKNESTLSHYIESSSEKQKQIASNILSCAIIGETNDKDVGIVGKENEKEAVYNEVVTKMKSANLLQNVIPNANFQNCTINFYGQCYVMFSLFQFG